MKKIELLIFIMLLLVVTDYSQTKEKNTTSIIWGENSKCYEYNSPEVKTGDLQCLSEVVNGKIFYIIYYNGISYALTYSVLTEDILAAKVQINNNSGKEIFIDSVNSLISKYKTEDFFRQNKKASNTAAAISPKKAADNASYRTSRSVVNEGNVGGESQTRASRDAGMAGMVIVEPSSLNTIRNQSHTQANPSDIPNSNPTLTIVKKDKKKAKRIIDAALVPIKLNNKEKTAGTIYFKHYKNAEFKAVFMRVDDLEFVFPLIK